MEAISRNDQNGRLGDSVHTYLDTLDRDALADLLRAHLADDPGLYYKLALQAARRRPGWAGSPGDLDDVAGLFQEVDRMLRPRQADRDRVGNAYTAAVSEVLDTVEYLLDRGQATVAVELAWKALAATAEPMLDDTDFSIVERTGDVIDRVVELHQRACRAAPPDPETLAVWLAHIQVDRLSIGITLDGYLEALGADGLAAYRAEVESLWQQFPQHDPDGNEVRSFRWFRVTELLKELVRRDGDVDRLVEIIASDLRTSRDYMEIVHVLSAAGRDAEALAWAERGHRDDDTRILDTELIRYLAETYERGGRLDDAIDVRFDAYLRSPMPHTYEDLHAVASSSERWPELDAQALEVARASQWPTTMLLWVLLRGGHIDEAWETARECGYVERDWLDLAERRAEYCPEDVLPVYRRLTEQAIGARNQAGYHRASAYLERLRDLSERTGRSAEFATYLADLRERHRTKRALMVKLTRQGL